jgi:hypothetical protein
MTPSKKTSDRAAYMREWRAARRAQQTQEEREAGLQKVREASRKWREENPEKAKAADARKDAEKKKAYMRDYYQRRREELIEAAKANYEKRKQGPDREEFLAAAAQRSKAYRERHPEKAKEMRDRAHARAKKRARDFVYGIKAVTPCSDCGGNFEAVCMDFDHCNGEKLHNIGTLMARGASIKKLAKEVAKCELVCANCHRLRTRDRLLREGIDIEEAMP